jgi:hypothetical protein
MLYDGKRPEELTREEIEAAAVYCNRMKHWAAMVFEQNDAGLQELAEEYERRLGLHLNINPDPQEARPGKLN